jgi:hypothetical protein
LTQVPPSALNLIPDSSKSKLVGKR